MKKLAFTLTEILIALGIIGTMMALSVAIVKPREIQYKYQVQQAQATLTEAMREAILRTDYTDHRFPKEAIDGYQPAMQLCRGLNETLNTTRATSEIGKEKDDEAYLGEKAKFKSQCKIETLNGMTFYIWAPSSPRPYCRLHVTRDEEGNVISSIPVATFIAFADIDGKGKYFDQSKDIPEANIKNKDFALGNLPAFFLDEDNTARPMPLDWGSYSQPTLTECGIPIN